MLKRTITGFFILLVTAGFILLKQFSNLFFDAFILVIMYGSLFEVVRVYKIAGKQVDYVLFLIPALLCVLLNLESNIFRVLGYMVLISLALVLYLLSMDILIYASKRKNPTNSNVIKTDNIVINAENIGINEKKTSEINKTLFDRTKYSMQAYVYPICSISLILALNHLEYNISYMGLIFIFACSMMTDTFAYLFGRSFGKRKFIPEVSPNKTVAGLIGGFVGGILASVICLLCYAYFPHFSNALAENKNALIFIFSILGVVGSLADQLGDLVASALKRKVGIKDYAKIFPGHGGFMDRVDGLMFTGAVTFIMLALFV